jgi:uncharacterized protein (TIGR02453 family)
MAYFTQELFDFLDDLEANNDRDWFAANKQRYLEHVQEPALDFIEAIGPRLDAISPHFLAQPKASGGSLFRIYRDTRFSKDKTPYKTNTGMQFRHAAGKDAHAAGFYLHIQPGESFLGVGLWRPPTSVAYQIREYIDEDQEAWRAAAHDEPFSTTFTLGGESLKRPPRGFSPDHPLIEDLKRKDFVGSRPLTEADIVADDALDLVADSYADATAFMRFLCRAVEVEF